MLWMGRVQEKASICWEVIRKMYNELLSIVSILIIRIITVSCLLQEDIFKKETGLSDSLLLGCRIVLKERKVVLGLMSKCQTISSKMVKQVTQVMKTGTGSMKQPSILNDLWVKCTCTHSGGIEVSNKSHDKWDVVLGFAFSRLSHRQCLLIFQKI